MAEGKEKTDEQQGNPEKTTGGSLNVGEVQPPHLTEKELKTEDQTRKTEKEREND